MAAGSADLPTDVETLQAMIIAMQEREVRLRYIIEQLQRWRFGSRSEKLSPDQYDLALEDREIACAEADALADQTDETASQITGKRRAKRPGDGRPSVPAHLPHVEEVLLPDATSCPCCGGALHEIDRDVAKRLDKIPARHRVIVTIRPKLACRACGDGVLQAPAPPHLVPGGLPTEALVADVLVSKYADHMPLYRQEQVLKRHGIEIDRATLANWVGRAAAVLKPLVARLKAELLASARLFVDETHVKVLAPGMGSTRTGYFWTIAQDDRGHGGAGMPGVVYSYMSNRTRDCAEQLLGGFHGFVQCDGYGAYKHIEKADREGGPGTLVFCWAHVRRGFFEIAKGGNAPIAEEALARIAKLYQTEKEVRGQSPPMRLAARQQHSKPVVDSLKTWLEAQLPRLPRSSKLAEKMRYALNHWSGLIRFLEDGRLELDNNSVERSMRPVALQRKNSLFAGHDLGAENWAAIASLIETCKLNNINPTAYFTDILSRLILRKDGEPIDDLLPAQWAQAYADAVNAELPKAA
jgi:transposase